MSQGGAEALLDALPTAQPTTCGTILELLTRMAPLGDARARLVSSGAADRADASCAALRGSHAAEAQRCQALAASLRQALERQGDNE